MKNSMDNKIRLQEYLDECGMDYVVDKRIKLCGFAYWGILYNTSFRELVNKLGEGLDYVGVEFNYVLVKESDLIEKYGDPFNFDDDFSVKGKSGREIEDRLQDYGFCSFGWHIGPIDDEQIMFIRVPSTTDSVKKRFCEVLNLSFDDVGRIYGDSAILGSYAWFYFKV